MKKRSLRLKPIRQQVVVITGSSSGIGLATAKVAAKNGAKVVIGSRNKEAIDEVVEGIRQEGGEAIGLRLDARQYGDHIKLRDAAINAYGRIDTWINNAGKSMYGKIMETDLEDEKDVMETNFWGIRHGCRVAVPVLSKHGGVLINLGSEVSSVGSPIQGMYSASKHAVKAFTDALRLELEKDNAPVVVTLVRPAAVNTPFAEHARNRLKKGAPSLPPPTYDVETVAKAILKAAETPQRDVYIGVVSRLFEIVSTLVPNLTDTFIGKTMFKQQTENDPKTRDKSQEAFEGPPAREGRTRARQPRRVSRTSAYTKARSGTKALAAAAKAKRSANGQDPREDEET